MVLSRHKSNCKTVVDNGANGKLEKGCEEQGD